MHVLFLGSGQKTAKRVNKSITGTRKRCRKSLEAYNTIPPYGCHEPPHKLVWDQINSPTAEIWQFMDTCGYSDGDVGVVIKRKVIELCHLNNRCCEEINICHQNLKRVETNLTDQMNQVKIIADEHLSQLRSTSEPYVL